MPVILPLTLAVPLNDCPQRVLVVFNLVADKTSLLASAALSTLFKPTLALVNLPIAVLIRVLAVDLLIDSATLFFSAVV
jgi:hypothetical protein